MTIDKNKMIKISVSVGEEEAGGMLVTESTYSMYSWLIDAINNNEDIKVIEINRGEPIYKNGTPFNRNTNSFLWTNEDVEKINESFLKIICLVGNTSVLYTQKLDPEQQEGLVAAYLSNPTFAMQEVDYV